MNFLLLLFAGAAIASLFPAKKYLRKQALLLLGCILTAGAGIALVLDHFTPLTQFLEWGGASTGLPLYLPGPSASVLGAGWGFFFVTFCWGVALIAVAILKKKTEEPQTEYADENLSEEDRIRGQLEEDIKNARSHLGDPAEHGKADATMTGGPVPQQNATDAPPGRFESSARQAFEAIAGGFIGRTVQLLQQGIDDSLTRLRQLSNEVKNRAYAEIARDHYGQHQNQIGAFEVQQLQQEFHAANQDKMRFVDSLNLKPNETADWPEKRTSLKQLIVLGVGFTLAEFIISWFFLKEQIGEAAIYLAATAALLILVLAFGVGAIFQFMRRNQPFTMRAFSGIGYLFCLFMLFLGFGLLLNYRDVDAVESAAGKFGAIMDGYASLASDLTNLLVFIINIAAFVFFYWKVLHFFDRFRGYKHVNDRYQSVKKRFEGLFEDNNDVVRGALQHADEKSQSNSRKAEACVNEITEKKNALERMNAIFAAAYAAIQRAYRGDVNEYRKSNQEHRSITVFPAPAYFHSPAPFGEADSHMKDADTGGDFLRARTEDFENMRVTRDGIVQKSAEWDAVRQATSGDLLNAFKKKINDLGAGQESPATNSGQAELQADR